jgi:hypothetical protein
VSSERAESEWRRRVAAALRRAWSGPGAPCGWPRHCTGSRASDSQDGVVSCSSESPRRRPAALSAFVATRAFQFVRETTFGGCFITENSAFACACACSMYAVSQKKRPVLAHVCSNTSQEEVLEHVYTCSNSHLPEGDVSLLPLYASEQEQSVDRYQGPSCTRRPIGRAALAARPQRGARRTAGRHPRPARGRLEWPTAHHRLGFIPLPLTNPGCRRSILRAVVAKL